MKTSFWKEVLENDEGLTKTLLRDFVDYNGSTEPTEYHITNQFTIAELIEKHNLEKRLLKRTDFQKHKIKSIISPETEVEQFVRKAINTEISVSLGFGGRSLLEKFDWSLFACRDNKWGLVPWPKNRNFGELFNKLKQKHNEGEIDLLERRLRFVGDKLEKRGETSLEKGQLSLNLARDIKKYLI